MIGLNFISYSQTARYHSYPPSDAVHLAFKIFAIGVQRCSKMGRMRHSISIIGRYWKKEGKKDGLPGTFQPSSTRRLRGLCCYGRPSDCLQQECTVRRRVSWLGQKRVVVAAGDSSLVEMALFNQS